MGGTLAPTPLPGLFFLTASDLLSSQPKAHLSGVDSYITAFQTLPTPRCTAQSPPPSGAFLICQGDSSRTLLRPHSTSDGSVERVWSCLQ